ncbi:MAG: hypothetical protein A2W25_05935 [candidate division Zixibacteria bacterium RBG_16_53_22]|nr:MAG: hypothetical protein A2W25_05935 [candidate division Zixibacteria bacterium RBG_16_53_22]
MSMMRRKIRGFTLVEVLVVVVILAILAAIAVPIYLRYVASARAGEAQEAIGAIWAAAKIYHSKYGNWPNNIQLLENDGLRLDQIVQNKWEFSISAGGTGIRTITARGTRAPVTGKNVNFNAQTGVWTGYGITQD